MPGCDLLLQAADADHEELVEVGLEDGQELEPFQQRHARILGLFQNAAIELQPAQLAVEIQRRIVEGCRCRHRWPLHITPPDGEDRIITIDPVSRDPTGERGQSRKGSGSLSGRG